MSRTHDYTNPHRVWGHDITWTVSRVNVMRLDASGWGKNIRRGDYLLLSQPTSGFTTRYRVDSIRYELDPDDMWHAELVFAPRGMPRPSLSDRWMAFWRRLGWGT